MFLSVLIPAYNEEALIARVIDSVRASFEAEGFADYEIVVCDNNSTDGTGRIARSLGAKVVFEPHNQIARARNAAAAGSSGPWLIFLDGDTFLSPALLRETLAAIDAGKVCGGGSVLRFDFEGGGLIARWALRYWNFISTSLRLAAGSFIFCSRRAWEETGGFDEDYYAAEEIVFSRKLKKWGRARGLRFCILTGAPVVTSGRKMKWYGGGQLLLRCFMMLRPGALRSREACTLWYSRPEKSVQPNNS